MTNLVISLKAAGAYPKKNPVQHCQTGFKCILVNDYSFTTPIAQNFSILCSISLSVFNLPKAAKSLIR
jgi:hypothetical protein